MSGVVKIGGSVNAGGIVSVDEIVRSVNAGGGAGDVGRTSARGCSQKPNEQTDEAAKATKAEGKKWGTEGREKQEGMALIPSNFNAGGLQLVEKEVDFLLNPLAIVFREEVTEGEPAVFTDRFSDKWRDKQMAVYDAAELTIYVFGRQGAHLFGAVRRHFEGDSRRHHVVKVALGFGQVVAVDVVNIDEVEREDVEGWFCLPFDFFRLRRTRYLAPPRDPGKDVF